MVIQLFELTQTQQPIHSYGEWQRYELRPAPEPSLVACVGEEGTSIRL